MRFSFILYIFFVSLITIPGVVNVFAMTSSNYKISWDSINIGGDKGTSTNYIVKDTLGEVSSGISTSTSYKLKAGYQQMVAEGYISLSLSTSSVIMSPSISGISGGSSNGSLTATVITDNSGGYSLLVLANTDPTLKCQSGECSTTTDNLLNYTPALANIPDYNWSMPATTSEFGFTPEGSDIIQKYKDNGSACNTGTNDTVNACWYNFSTSNETISQSFSSNHPGGINTNIKLQAEVGSEFIQAPGEYQAVITITAITN